MRVSGAGRGLVVAGVCGFLLAACSGSATVLSRTQDGLVLRWDERRTSRGTVAEQALNLCSAYGFNARRPVALADEVEGTTHTTRYACQGARTGGLPL